MSDVLCVIGGLVIWAFAIRGFLAARRWWRERCRKMYYPTHSYDSLPSESIQPPPSYSTRPSGPTYSAPDEPVQPPVLRVPRKRSVDVGLQAPNGWLTGTLSRTPVQQEPPPPLHQLPSETEMPGVLLMGSKSVPTDAQPVTAVPPTEEQPHSGLSGGVSPHLPGDPLVTHHRYVQQSQQGDLIKAVSIDSLVLIEADGRLLPDELSLADHIQQAQDRGAKVLDIRRVPDDDGGPPVFILDLLWPQ
jgi:hypothetical protein